MAHVFFNGNVLAEEDVRLPPSAGAVLYGSGVFASLICLGGRPFALTDHYSRFSMGAVNLGLRPPSLSKVLQAILAVLEKNNLTEDDARCRVWLGEGAPGCPPLFLVSVGEIPPHQPEADVGICPWRRNPDSALQGIKSISYAENIQARRWAERQGLTEALFLNTRDEICEGTTSNLFLVEDGDLPRVCTPSPTTGCLPGVTREKVMQLTMGMGITLSEGRYDARHLEHVQEAFLTSTYRRIQPVRSLEGRKLRTNGPITSKLQDAWASMEKRFRTLPRV